MTDSVLVTGGSGLIGRQVVSKLLDAGAQVTMLTFGNERTAAPSIEGLRAVECNLLEPRAVDAALGEAEASHLVHLAWHQGAKDRWTSPKNFEWADATTSLLRQFVEHGGKRAVCVGSCAEYDWSDELLSESTPLEPKSVYGKAKVQAFHQSSDLAAALDLSLAWTRVFFCYGPGEPKGRLIGDLLSGLIKKEPVECTDGLQKRDFLHTADVGRALVDVLKSSLEGAVNVGSGTATPVREIISCAARLLNGEHLIRWGAIPRPEGDPARIYAEVERLQSIGFRPKFDLVSGLEDCIMTRRQSESA